MPCIDAPRRRMSNASALAGVFVAVLGSALAAARAPLPVPSAQPPAAAPTPAPASAPTPAPDAPQTSPPAHPAQPGAKAAPTLAHGCLPTGNGYLRARIRGALSLDINWHNADIECDGGPRPGGRGVRVSFAGPPHADGRRLRMVFGVGAVREGHAGRDLPTNLTVIFEGEQHLFATRGDDHCTVDELRQERVGALGGPKRSWRIVARGFCISPVSALDSEAHILVSRFDFAGNAVFEDEPGTARGL